MEKSQHISFNMLIAGVGGQGTLLASKILGNYAQLIGKDCKMSEVHGMAQRGGSVITHVRVADKVHSPLFNEKQADIILAFEELEALRWAGHVKEDGIIIVNKQNIYPMPCAVGMAEYPEDIYEQLAKYNAKIHKIDAIGIANKLGETRTVNIAMLGFCAAILNFNKEIFIDAIKKSVAASTVEINLKAFEHGYALAAEGNS
ncbi:MAG: indolepyruvate oxidoreductase subunit beta [Fibromonadaceae bacterium]|nr:indolepyruvate oxidoreductase subunit beta [Fibromonadaceae bacterium]